MLHTVYCKFSLVNFSSNFNESLTGYTSNLTQLLRLHISHLPFTDTESMMFTLLQSLVQLVVEFLADSCGKIRKVVRNPV